MKYKTIYNRNILDSWICFWHVFWILGSVFGFWDVFLDPGKCLWTLGHVLDSGKCFWNLRRVFGFWEVFSWILGNALFLQATITIRPILLCVVFLEAQKSAHISATDH